MIHLIFTVLATYGLATLITEYDGPFDVFARLRSKGKVLRCTVCLGTWLAIPICLFAFPSLPVAFMGYLATIGGLIALDRTIN